MERTKAKSKPTSVGQQTPECRVWHQGLRIEWSVEWACRTPFLCLYSGSTWGLFISVWGLSLVPSASSENALCVWNIQNILHCSLGRTFTAQETPQKRQTCLFTDFSYFLQPLNKPLRLLPCTFSSHSVQNSKFFLKWANLLIIDTLSMAKTQFFFNKLYFFFLLTFLDFLTVKLRATITNLLQPGCYPVLNFPLPNNIVHNF